MSLIARRHARLAIEQTPYRADERERIREAGGLVCSHEQLVGNVEMHDNWGDVDLGAEIDASGDPPRVWKSAKAHLPGCAFTRSLGDAIGEEVTLATGLDPRLTPLPSPLPPDGAPGRLSRQRPLRGGLAQVGVFAEAEIVQKDIEPSDVLLILASDGVWEFMTNQVRRSLGRTR